ncbi:MAG: ThiF family adenylyltransferase [Acidobacteriota bacterium]|jgi:adenylyltransferase/sulfurtransferase|nr:ThiF family adenylyltransferase [Acidobacteriota bacterium]
MKQENEITIPPRYSRQILFGGIGEQGQARIMASRVVVVGCGALGALQTSFLARAGVGTLRIIDRDFVEESNLQRQILFDEQDVRDLLPKAAAAEKKLRVVNSLVNVEGIVDEVNASTVDRLLGGFDLIMDASDNFDVRFLINEYAVKNGVPWVYGAVVGSYGLTFPIIPGEGACLRCVFESAPPPGVSPSCDTAGVIGPIIGSIVSIQVAEALKLLSGARDRVRRKITTIDMWENRYDAIELPPPFADCACCGRREYPYMDGSLGAEAETLCGRNSVQIRPKSQVKMDFDDLAARLAPLGAVEQNRFLLRADIDGYQITVFSDGRAIIQGTYDMAVAKSMYARYIGN